ncbi:hypothetical protein HDU76_011705 [Blyttiomyces sp. JEL0837]|nr:hypothetical protein HDU76_011705 [Blyttiomyces sp. JEL0837]
MQDPLHDLPRAAKQILSTDVIQVARTVYEVYDPNAVMYHPYFAAHGRRQIERVYEFWARAHTELSAEVDSIAWDPDKKTANVEITQTLTSKYWPGKHRSDLTGYQVQRPVPGNKWIIARQDDLYNVYELIYAFFLLPWIGWFVMRLTKLWQWIGITIVSLLVYPFRFFDRYVWSSVEA